MNAARKNIVKIFKRVFKGAEEGCLSREHPAIVLASYINITKHVK